MTSIHRINALIAYKNGSVSNYTAAYDGQEQKTSHTDVATTEAELYSWPAFRDFMEGIDSIQLGSVVDISHVKDIAWSVAMSDVTGKLHIGGFEAKGGSGTNSNTVYTSSNFPTVGDEISDKLGGAATATATMKLVFSQTTVTRGSGYNDASSLTLSVLGGVSSSQAPLDVNSLSTVSGQTEANYSGGEITGTFVPGTGHSALDFITLSDGSGVLVDTVGTAGDVIEFTIVAASTSGSSNWATIAQSGSTGGGTGFSITQDDDNQGVFAVSLNGSAGDYTALPSNPVSTTPSAGGGTGATFNVTWGVLAVTVTDGGSGYVAVPVVTMADAGGGEEASVTAVLTGDVVTSATVVSTGGGYVARAVVTIAAPV